MDEANEETDEEEKKKEKETYLHIQTYAYSWGKEQIQCKIDQQLSDDWLIKHHIRTETNVNWSD